MNASVHQIVTFSDHPFGGNPAFVLVSEAPLPQATLQRVAQQLREPVLSEISGPADRMSLRFATPSGPHPGAGHAAHAAAFVALNEVHPHSDGIVFALADGRQIRASRNSNGPSVEWPIMPFETADTAIDVASCIGVRPEETLLAPFGLVAVLRSSTEVASIVPDLDRIAALAANTLTVTAHDDSGDFAIRVFAPKLGLPEDPVCGTAHRIVVPMWSRRLGKTNLISHQLSPRGGTLYCELGDGTVTLSGAAIPFLEGSLAVDLR